MKFSLTVESEGTVLTDHLAKYELGYAVQKVAVKINEGETSGKVIDSNGNTVGSWEVSY